MKDDRPSFKTYRAHVYRQFFGSSLSLKPIKDKDCRRYVVLETTPYKLFWYIYWVAAFILACLPGLPFGFFPSCVLIALYILVVPIRYFFTRFVELGSDFVTYELCEKASKKPRPSFGAYLGYALSYGKERLTLYIEENGNQYIWSPRLRIPAYILFYTFGFALIEIGRLMGIGMLLLDVLILACIYLLLSLLSWYFYRFENINDSDDDTPPAGSEPLPVLLKITRCVMIAAAIAVNIFMFNFLLTRAHDSNEIALSQPLTPNTAYDAALDYTLERFDKAELVNFYIEYIGADVLLMGVPSHIYFELQDTPGLLPEPNETISFYSDDDSNNMNAFYEDYAEIQLTINTRFVTDPSEVVAVLESELGESFVSNITYMRITPADRSPFRVHNANECEVEIRRGEQDYEDYIVNIADKTVRRA